ncbi:MAG: AEC family transporter [Gemmatimonadetes bacterium]|nr:AEC family transporter [Gemmatimonadota bacterium]MDA1102473.1 AEC family transporter [Gemmatimonadota bacterium]
MGTLLETMVPVFGLMALGFAAARRGVIDDAGVKGLVLFVFNFSIPSLLLGTMARTEFPTDIEWGFMVAFYASSLITYGLGVGVGRFLFARPLHEQAIFGMGAAFSNIVLMGIPIVLTALGPEAALPMFLIIGFHSATFMPLSVGLIQAGLGSGTSKASQFATISWEILRNPIIVGILVGLAVNWSGVTIWPALDRLLEFLGLAAVPCALFAMGASLASYSLVGEVRPAIVLSLLKLLIHPLLVWIIAVPILGLGGLWVSVAVVMASMPSAVNVYLFGARYDAAPEVAARTVLLTSVCSIFTISIVLTLVGA